MECVHFCVCVQCIVNVIHEVLCVCLYSVDVFSLFDDYQYDYNAHIFNIIKKMKLLREDFNKKLRPKIATYAR